MSEFNHIIKITSKKAFNAAMLNIDTNDNQWQDDLNRIDFVLDIDSDDHGYVDVIYFG